MTRPPANGTPADPLAADRRAALRLVPVSRETEERLAAFVALLDRWRETTNLISNATFASVWTRHVADCAQLLALAPDARRWVDMGSGAGFPGLVIAIQLADVPGRESPLHRKRPAQMRLSARSRAGDRGRRDHSPRAGRSDRARKPRTCGRRDRARLRPLAADAQIGETLDGAGRRGRVSARRIELETRWRPCLRRRLMRSNPYPAPSTPRPRSCAFADAETAP